MQNEESKITENRIEGRNAVLEAFRSGKTIDKLYVLDGCQDGPVKSITREARKHDTIINYVAKERLDQLSETGKHQGVIAVSAAYEYAEVEDILAAAEAKGEAPFIIILDGIEDPHNLGAIIRTANQAGAHGVIIPKRRAVGLTPTVARTSAGAINYTPVAKVTNISNTMKELKDKGMWFVCADMDGTGDQSGPDHRGSEKARSLVCLCRYGRRGHVPPEFKGTDRTCDRKRRRWRQSACQEELRHGRIDSDEGRY